MPYRDNENETLTEQLATMRERITGWEERLSSMRMTGEQKQNASIVRSIVGGVVVLALVLAAGEITCNRVDNATRIEVAKQCPAVVKETINEARPNR